ncbi:hypothetical protein [Arachnia propionica]|uniref:Uncharacterized protein n=1 Tax=Arachnia propionica TaxID=1750 RepID=A0A3P1WT89_9ACTN|nr:hypothetical protein [Arachnia propionica]RRD49381.1 hypothetical protein EII35_08430 [Arachnia propionica]
MTTISLPEIAEIVWHTTAAWRATTCHDGTYCPTKRAPYGHGDPGAVMMAEECRRKGCLDLVHELLMHVETSLTKESVQRNLEGVAKVGGYIRTMVTTHMSDMRRKERVKRGFPAKTNRDDGAPGRVNAVLRTTEGERGEWLVQIFRILRSWPFGANHVAGHWPVSGLTQEYLKNHKDPIDEAQVLADIRKVLQVAKEVLGATWVHDHLTLPSHSNGPAEALSDTSALAEPPTTDHALATMLVSAYDRLQRKGASDDEALMRAIKEIYGVEVRITREIREAVQEFRQAG